LRAEGDIPGSPNARTVLETSERPLNADERDQLMARRQNARAESSRALLKTGGASGAVCGVLMLLTLWFSDAPVAVIVGFWSLMTLLFTLWIGMPWRRVMRGQIPILEDALQANRARDLRLRSNRVVEFEEVDDEGACYAFDRDGSSSIFITGQEFYEDDDFPNSDFSMIELLGTNGTVVDVLLAKSGRKLTPERVIPAGVKNSLELPEHLEVLPVPLDRIESALRRRSSPP
jgi:hypothetical protein